MKRTVCVCRQEEVKQVTSLGNISIWWRWNRIQMRTGELRQEGLAGGNPEGLPVPGWGVWFHLMDNHYPLPVEPCGPHPRENGS